MGPCFALFRWWEGILGCDRGWIRGWVDLAEFARLRRWGGEGGGRARGGGGGAHVCEGVRLDPDVGKDVSFSSFF